MTSKSKSKTKCVICRTSADDTLNLGEMKTYKNITAHYYCLLLASTIKQSGKDEEGILGFLPTDIKDEIKSSQKRECVYCKRPGAAVLCSVKNCKMVFHLPCGIENNSGHQFHGSFLSHCLMHRPRQKYKRTTEIQTCPICYDSVDFQNWTEVLCAPCCKKQSFFHKKCIQQMALSAGYFFKCPMCNNCAVFQKTMKHYGVFIPDRDASWELEPNAFEELLYRHTECNAKTCLCKSGRKYDNLGPWNIILCSMCGSQGTHVHCSKLKKNQEWICELCVIEKKVDNQINDINGINGMNGVNDVNGIMPPLLHQPSTSNSNHIPPMPIQIPNNIDASSSTLQSKPNKRKRNRSLRSSKTITNFIEIDSEDSDVVVIEDEPNIKCLIAQDRSLLKVHKSTKHEEQQQYKNEKNVDIENQDSSSCTDFMNLVITDVRSLSEPPQQNFIESNKPNSKPFNVIDVASEEFKNIHNKIMLPITVVTDQQHQQQQQQLQQQPFFILQEMIYNNNNISLYQGSSSNHMNSSSSDDIVIID